MNNTHLEIPFDMNTTTLLPIHTVIESKNFVYVFEHDPCYTLGNALLYSPAIFENNHNHLLFVFYQLLQIFIKFDQLNLKIDNKLTLNEFFITQKSLWLTVSPFTFISPHAKQPSPQKVTPIIQIYDGMNTKLKENVINLNKKLNVYTDAWCKKEISNFDYLIILNKLSGRVFGDSLNYPVFPWITDFTLQNGGLRDLTKTKFRLNKGDGQLDATYMTGILSVDSGISNLPKQHHVSDVLSDITYYIYHARDTPKEILCKHVRSRWVPDEYPTSIERMYQWTPDECIPEFFYDPNILKSIHPDLNNLVIPEWLDSPEEFVKYHYELLESNRVSKYLHHWIDLIFGYALKGAAAKKEKNVHLSLVDGHKDLRNFGIVQLFTEPHPKRKIDENESEYLDETDSGKDSE